MLYSALGDDLERFRRVLSAYAAELRADGSVTDETFQVTAEMREGLYDRLIDEGVTLSPRPTRMPRAYVADQLGYEIARELFGTESVVRRQAKADRQLQAALRLLRASDDAAGDDHRRGGGPGGGRAAVGRCVILSEAKDYGSTPLTPAAAR